MPIEVNARARGFVVVMVAAGVALLAAGDLLRGAPRLGVVLAVRAVWIAALLLLAVLVHRRGGPPTRAPAVAVALVSIGALAVLAWADEGTTGALVFLVASPLFIAVVVPDSRVAAVAAVASLAAVAGVAAALGRAPLEAIGLGARAAIAGAFACFGSALHERARRTEVALAVERARAVEALSAAGAKAAVAAHDMSGPLAAIKGNLSWLAEAVEGGRLHAEEAEAREALQDARAAAEALAVAVGRLREAGVGAKRTATGEEPIA